MLPIGIWVARSFKTLDPWWFMGHLALQVRWAQLCLQPAFNAVQCSAAVVGSLGVLGQPDMGLSLLLRCTYKRQCCATADAAHGSSCVVAASVDVACQADQQAS